MVKNVSKAKYDEFHPKLCGQIAGSTDITKLTDTF